jgi:hypothetical protein
MGHCFAVAVMKITQCTANSQQKALLERSLLWEQHSLSLALCAALCPLLLSNTAHEQQVAVGDKAPDGTSPRVVITVTPTDGGDTDVFLTSSKDREPGPQQYDIRSEAWSGSDVVVFSEGVYH